MHKKVIFRLLVDMTMLLLTTLLMAYTLAENQLHELFGGTFFALYFLHQALNIKWFRGLLTGKYTLRRIVNTVVDVLISVAMLALMVSGMMISQSVMPFLNFGSVVVGRTIHTLASHWYLLLMAIHLGLHLEMILAVVDNVTGKRWRGKVAEMLTKALAIVISLWGIVSFVKRGIGEKLILYSAFPYFNNGDTWLAVFMDFGAIICVIAIASFYANRYLKKCIAVSFL